MIVPTLRGYETDPESNVMQILCKRCKVPRLIYRRVNLKRPQQRIPAFCLKCGSMVVVELVKTK